MAVAPKKKSLKPGEKVDLKLKKAKVKAAQLKKINIELGRLVELNQSLKYRAPTSKAVQKQINALMIAVQQEIKNQQLLIAKLELAPLEPYIKILQKECSQAIAVYKQAGKVLLRGSKNAPAAFVGKSWNQRNPKDSDKLGQELFDAALTKLGITALRSNSIFTSSTVEQAANYGSVYMIFPKNGFQFSWTKFDPDVVIDDPTEIWKEKFIEKLEIDINRFYNKKIPNFWDLDVLMSIIDHGGIQGFANKLKNDGYPKADLMTADNLVDAKKIKTEYGPDNKNFLAAIQSGGEVLISGEYYAFALSSFEAMLDIMGIDTSDNY